MTGNPLALILVAAGMFALLGGISLLSHIYNLNHIKAKTVGDGQHGTARWATKAEIRKTYRHIPFTPKKWREQAKNGLEPTGADGKPLPQGIVVGCTGKNTALVDTDDVHVLMIGAAGVGKTAYWLYPRLEYACACGMYYICFKELIEVLFSSITITPTQVVWKCLFKKTCRIARCL